MNLTGVNSKGPADDLEQRGKSSYWEPKRVWTQWDIMQLVFSPLMIDKQKQYKRGKENVHILAAARHLWQKHERGEDVQRNQEGTSRTLESPTWQPWQNSCTNRMFGEWLPRWKWRCPVQLLCPACNECGSSIQKMFSRQKAPFLCREQWADMYSSMSSTSRHPDQTSSFSLPLFICGCVYDHVSTSTSEHVRVCTREEATG